MAIREVQLISRVDDPFARARKRYHFRHDLLHLAAIRARVHPHGAADRAGNTAGEFQAGQFRFRRGARGLRQTHAAGHDKSGAVGIAGAHQSRKTDHNAAHAAVTHQHVRPAAENHQRAFFVGDNAQYARQFRLGLRLDIEIRRPADRERRMPRHRFGKMQRALGDNAGKQLFPMLYGHCFSSAGAKRDKSGTPSPIASLTIF